MMKKLVACAAICLLSLGCSTTGGSKTQQQRIESGVYVASAIGTSIALQEHPEWRPGFELALNDLKILETQPADMVTLMAIITRLPVKELRSSQATLIIEGAIILLSDQFGTTEVAGVDDKVKDIRPYIIAIRRGIERGLTNNPVPNQPTSLSNTVPTTPVGDGVLVQ